MFRGRSRINNGTKGLTNGSFITFCFGSCRWGSTFMSINTIKDKNFLIIKKAYFLANIALFITKPVTSGSGIVDCIARFFGDYGMLTGENTGTAINLDLDSKFTTAEAYGKCIASEVVNRTHILVIDEQGTVFEIRRDASKAAILSETDFTKEITAKATSTNSDTSKYLIGGAVGFIAGAVLV